MTRIEVLQLVKKMAEAAGLDDNLACAIATVESNGNPLACRYEAYFPWLVTPDLYANLNQITQATEQVLQAMSWGPMQVMGAVARECGFKGPLVSLTEPELGITYGLKKLSGICAKYENENAVIAAYNAGSPRKLPGGDYVNQKYVASVQEKLKALRACTTACGIP